MNTLQYIRITAPMALGVAVNPEKKNKLIYCHRLSTKSEHFIGHIVFKPLIIGYFTRLQLVVGYLVWFMRDSVNDTTTLYRQNKSSVYIFLMCKKNVYLNINK